MLTTRLKLELILISLARMVVTTLYRMVFPFLPLLARGIGVSLQLAAAALSVRALVGLISPFLGMLGDRWGRRQAMVLGLGLFALGAGVIGLWATYPAFVAGMFLTGMSKVLLDTASQAYAGDRVPYALRGKAVALLEVNWSAGYLIGVPIVGWLIGRAGWQAPFPWFVTLGLGFGVLIWLLIPKAPLSDPILDPSDRQVGWLKQVFEHPAAAGMLGVVFLMTTGIQSIFITYGAWMEVDFNVDVLGLGLLSAILGLAELGGEGLVAILTDRLGKRRSVAIGLGINVMASVVVVLAGASLMGAMIGLMLVFIGFEFALVSSISLISELAPKARASLLAANTTMLEIASGVAAFVGPWLYRGGMNRTALGAGLFSLFALAVLLRVVRRRGGADQVAV